MNLIKTLVGKAGNALMPFHIETRADGVFTQVSLIPNSILSSLGFQSYDEMDEEGAELVLCA